MCSSDLAQFHTLRTEVAALDDWGLLAEVIRYRELEDQRSINDTKLHAICGDLALINDAMDLCRHRLAAAQLHKRVGQLEGLTGGLLASATGAWKRRGVPRGRGARF